MTTPPSSRALTPLQRLEAVACAYDPVEGPVEFTNAEWISIRTDIFMVAQASRSERQPATDTHDAALWRAVMAMPRDVNEVFYGGDFNAATLKNAAFAALRGERT